MVSALVVTVVVVSLTGFAAHVGGEIPEDSSLIILFSERFVWKDFICLADLFEFGFSAFVVVGMVHFG